MSQEKQTKRLKTKKIASYVLIGILVCVFLVSTLGNAFSASAADAPIWYRTHNIPNESNLGLALHLNTEYYSDCITTNDTYEGNNSYTYPDFSNCNIEKYYFPIIFFDDTHLPVGTYPCLNYVNFEYYREPTQAEQWIVSVNVVSTPDGFMYFEVFSNGNALKSFSYNWYDLSDNIYGERILDSSRCAPYSRGVFIDVDDNYKMPYVTYAERISVYHESAFEDDIICTEKIDGLGGRQNGTFYIADYADRIFGSSPECRARDIKVKGWCLRDGGVDYYSYTIVYDNETSYTKDAINLYSADFLTKDLASVANRGQFLDYAHNAHYSFYIERPYETYYRNQRVDYIDIIAHFVDGTTGVVLRIDDVIFDTFGGEVCECGDRCETTFKFYNHYEHSQVNTCVKCKKTTTEKIEHLDFAYNEFCDYCYGANGDCRSWTRDDIKIKNSQEHTSKRTCNDCGADEVVYEEHLFNSKKICTVCDFTELTYKTFDEGYTAGYDEALKAIAYGIFTDVKVNYAIQYNSYLGDQWDEHTASDVEVNESGIAFSQYYNEIDKCHNKFLEKHTDDDYYDSVRRFKITVTFADWFVWQERMLSANFVVPEGDFLENYLESIWVYSPDGTSYEVTTTQTGNSSYDIILDDYFGQTQDVEAPIGQIGFIFYLTKYDDINTILNTMKFGINSSVMVYGASNSYYNQGYADGIAQGEVEHQEAFKKGMAEGMVHGAEENYNLGYVDGFERGQNSDNMFTTLFTGIFDSITLAFCSMLNFEVLGVNVAMFALSLITLGLIIIVVKKFI